MLKLYLLLSQIVVRLIGIDILVLF